MGDRISISFRNGNDLEDESVALFSHWGGKSFLNSAMKYLRKLKEELKKEGKGISAPIYRLEPSTVMVDFIREITKGMKRVESDLYLGKDCNDGDNSDNGHFAIDLNTEELL